MDIPELGHIIIFMIMSTSFEIHVLTSNKYWLFASNIHRGALLMRQMIVLMMIVIMMMLMMMVMIMTVITVESDYYDEIIDDLDRRDGS